MFKYFFKLLIVTCSLVSTLVITSGAKAESYMAQFNYLSAVDESAGGHLGLSFLNTAPTGTFATLSYDSSSDVFTLNAASNFDGFFGVDTFIDAVAFNTVQPRSEINDVNVSGGGIVDFVESTNGLPDFAVGIDDDFDILYRAGDGAVLTQGEAVTFTISGLNPNCFTSTTCDQNSLPIPASVFAIRVTNNPA